MEHRQVVYFVTLAEQQQSLGAAERLDLAPSGCAGAPDEST
jgi:DNA-binding transcriptional LysR family regulator